MTTKELVKKSKHVRALALQAHREAEKRFVRACIVVAGEHSIVGDRLHEPRAARLSVWEAKNAADEWQNVQTLLVQTAELFVACSENDAKGISQKKAL